MVMNSPTEMLEAEHRVIAKVVGAVPVLADGLDADQVVNVDLLHDIKEDYLLFPMTNKVLSLDEQQLLSSEFEKVEERIGLNHYRRLEELAEHLAEITSTVNGEIEPHASGSSPS
jgi:hemerythrin-like domain-containing protein